MLFHCHSVPFLLTLPLRWSLGFIFLVLLLAFDPAVGLCNKQESEFRPPAMEIPTTTPLKWSPGRR